MAVEEIRRLLAQDLVEDAIDKLCAWIPKRGRRWRARIHYLAAQCRKGIVTQDSYDAARRELADQVLRELAEVTSQEG